ncbi:MAG: HlyD family secretion protein [Caulobacteraceae bacterium]|nr:HlyD family secretion protein [Caulobacteraceae bacterium]
MLEAEFFAGLAEDEINQLGALEIAVRTPPSSRNRRGRNGGQVMDAKVSDEEAGSSSSMLLRLKARFTRRTRFALMFGLPALAIIALVVMMVTGGRYQETENAYVQAARVPISTSVPGRIGEMRVHDNDTVRAGQILFVLDQANPQADVAQFEAALASARARVASLQAEYRAQSAGVRAREEGLAFARSELARAPARRGRHSRARDVEAARHGEEQALAELAGSRQSLAAALASLGGSPNVDVEEHPSVREAAARLERARLALSYTEVIALQDGVVTRVDQVQVGTFVNAGQTLFWLIAGEPWVEANFKENQIAQMRAGQRATIRIDSFGGRAFEARVASFSPGTGAVFLPLPAQNATGNWVKVVQRIPVRLTFVDPPPDLIFAQA